MLALAGFVPVPLEGQDAAVPPEAGPNEREVVEVLIRFFDGMRAKDTAMIRSTLHEDARLVTTGTDREGRPMVRATPLDAFLEAIAGAEGHLDERLYGTEVRIDGNLAAVWTEYDFFHDGRLSHCGVDAFQLARTTTSWKIFQIADTRREQGCRAGDPDA